MVVSRHAYQRASERNGLSKKAMNRLVEKVWSQGIRAEQATGMVRQWGNAILFSTGERPLDTLVFYGDKAYLFNEGVLITILQMPSSCQKTMNSLRKKSCIA
ncbi:MAG: hypothetical protein MJ105_09510 [Lachnospiraceae bacterium]|nr:hypothetical protein [Lachnospiraceae bacterium]